MAIFKLQNLHVITSHNMQLKCCYFNVLNIYKWNIITYFNKLHKQFTLIFHYDKHFVAQFRI